MKRALGGILIGLVAVFCLAPHAAATANDFKFSSFDADYYLGSDSEGRATLRTVERLVALFPDYDQNHGIERAIPLNYDGHGTGLNITSVTDGQGRAVQYTTSRQNDDEVLQIGSPDHYVHGITTYVITYTQRDVTKYFADQKDDEFYWDTNGTQWGQSFDTVTARLHLSGSISPTFTRKVACYQGKQGDSAQCEINASGAIVTATAAKLGPGENMTIVAGFTPGTFRGYQPSFLERLFSVWIIWVAVTTVISIAAVVWLIVRYKARSNRTKELPPIAAEYIPPSGVSVLTSSKIGEGTRASTTAQIMDLAVRHYITIKQIREKSLMGAAEYELQIVQPVDALTQEEQSFVQALFGDTAASTTLNTKTMKNNYKVANALQKNAFALTKLISGAYELRAVDAVETKRYKRVGIVVGAVSIVTVSPALLIAGVAAYVYGVSIKPLTDKGLALRRYLAGLKQYIEVAEKDRIAMLQSPEGAQKTGVSTGDNAQLIKLYERTLPYAVLFGQEREWNRQLALRYEQAGTAPDWYAGNQAFSAIALTSALNDFTSSVNSYSSSTSSSYGGTGGGGFSGGGGGGGGGGGW
jgi:uncharacterized membrane protein YgcG